MRFFLDGTLYSLSLFGEELEQAEWLKLCGLLGINALKFPLFEFDFHADDYKNRLVVLTEIGIEALQIFSDHRFYHDAYGTSLLLLDLIELAKHSDITIGLNENQLYQQAEGLRNRLEIKPRSG